MFPDQWAFAIKLLDAFMFHDTKVFFGLKRIFVTLQPMASEGINDTAREQCSAHPVVTVSL